MKSKDEEFMTNLKIEQLNDKINHKKVKFDTERTYATTTLMITVSLFALTIGYSTSEKPIALPSLAISFLIFGFLGVLMSFRISNISSDLDDLYKKKEKFLNNKIKNQK